MSLKLTTQIHIQAAPDKVWDVLMDFDYHPQWNPFIKHISGSREIGEMLNIELGGMKFKPIVKEMKENREFRWLGKLWFKGLFDGEHQFILEPNEDGTTTFHQNESFRGVLVPIFKKKLLEETKSSFEEMNVALKVECEKKLN